MSPWLYRALLTLVILWFLGGIRATWLAANTTTLACLGPTSCVEIDGPAFDWDYWLKSIVVITGVLGLLAVFAVIWLRPTGEKG